MSGARSEWTRRGFLKVAAVGGGFAVGFPLSSCLGLRDEPGGRREALHRLHAFVAVRGDGIVSNTAPLPEIGQGVRTSLPMIVAEELAVRWEDVRVEQAAAHDRFGSMSVGGSDSVHDYWEPLRLAGASAREMLIRAAAEHWGVPPAECRAADSRVIHGPTERALGYGELAAAAAALDPVDDPPLTPPEELDVVGPRIPRVDLEPIVRGQAVYGIDVKVPGMLFAVLERPPVMGAVLEAWPVCSTGR